MATQVWNSEEGFSRETFRRWWTIKVLAAQQGEGKSCDWVSCLGIWVGCSAT